MKGFRLFIAIIIWLATMAVMLIGVPQWFDYFKLPNWLRYVLAAPYLVFCIFVATAAYKDFIKNED